MIVLLSRLFLNRRPGRWTARSLVLVLVNGWLPLAAVLTLVSGLVYGAVQQDLRQNANDPQIQMAEDAAAAVGSGQPAQAVVGAVPVDMASSLAPYLMVFAANGQLVAASVRLDGAPPTLPAGLASYMSEHNEDRVTWQPRAGVRSAAVLRRVADPPGGFVLAGRSLREVEIRETAVLRLVAAIWLGGLGGLLVLVLGGRYLAELWPLRTTSAGHR